MGRRKGEGSKYKRVINGKTLFVYETTQNGKKFTAYSSKSYAEAYRKLTSKLEFSIKGDKILVKDLTFRWLSYKKGKVKHQTLRAYQSDIANHIIPEFGEQYIHQITTEDLDRFYVSLPLAPSSIKRLHLVMKMLFQFAIKYEHASSDSTQNAETPMIEKPPIKVLTNEECIHLLKLAKNTSVYLPVRIALETGMRLGEILGLKYEDIIGNEICVSRTVITRRVGDKDILDFNATKNGTSRIIDITPDLVKEINPDNKKRGLVFTSPRAKTNNDIWTPRSFRASWISLREKAGFPDLKFHDLRHTHISHLLHKGVSLPVVSQRAGHRDPTVTLNIYSHIINRSNVSAVMSFARALDE